MQTRLELPFRAPGSDHVAPLSALYEEGSAGARRGGLLLAHGAGYGLSLIHI